MSKRVAVIDIGSNSIKALVAEKDGSEYGINALFESSREVRISDGISGNPPVLSESSIQAGVDAVETLYKQCTEIGNVSQTQIVATSAVRSAINGVELIDKVQERTGENPNILSGPMEAEGIAFGVRTDPAIMGNLDHFTVFDLGGGSLELIRFKNNHVVKSISLPLGSVRLTEQFISNTHSPVLRDRANAIISHIRASIQEANFTMGKPLIGCSGGLTTWRAIRAKRMGVDLEKSTAIFSKNDVINMAREVVFKTLKHRINTVHIPPERADIFPVALLTFKALMELADTSEIIHSLHSLRYGIAWELLWT